MLPRALLPILAFLVTTPAFASDYGYTHFGCVEIASSIFEKEASGTGSSCALINRKKKAESRAVDNLEIDAQAECEDIRDANPEFWDAYCQLVCEYNGFEEETGIDWCDYTVTDESKWTGSGCVMGRKQYNRQEADVACGCGCRTYYPPE